MLIYSITMKTDLLNIPEWAKWIELRVDLSPNLVNYLRNLQEYNVIITDRSIEEGGKSKRSFREKLKYYQDLGSHDNIFYDLEINIIEENIDISPNFGKYFLSYHNFFRLNNEEIISILKKAETYKPYMIKLAQECQSIKELKQLYDICLDYKRNILWLVMGEYGHLQRSLYPYFTSAGSYIASKGNETVEGQLNIQSVENYQHLIKGSMCKWGGLIGGKHVYSSLGIEYYNSHFKKNNIDAIYLPIFLKDTDLEAFFDLVKNNKLLSDNCYGFSLTMPFKKTIPQLFHKEEISNLMITKAKYNFYNTDYDAMMKIKEKLSEKNIRKVLIYGSGSMAELALRVFSEYDITLTARNKARLLQMKAERKKIEIIDQITPELYFDLLINTSPIGMKGEDFSQETGISKFKYVIDLPYSHQEIPLAKQVPGDRYFSGREFWQYQSERQLQLFKESIEYDKK